MQSADRHLALGNNYVPALNLATLTSFDLLCSFSKTELPMMRHEQLDAYKTFLYHFEIIKYVICKMYCM